MDLFVKLAPLLGALVTVAVAWGALGTKLSQLVEALTKLDAKVDTLIARQAAQDTAIAVLRADLEHALERLDDVRGRVSRMEGRSDADATGRSKPVRG